MTTDEIMNRSYDDEMKAIDVAIQDQTTEIIVQDDLSDATFTKFACVVQGHSVQE